MDEVEFHREPPSNISTMVVAFGGWIDAGEAVTGAMRHLVRQQIAQGKSDQQIEDFLVARYGDFILMKPPVEKETYVLWFAPLIALGVGALIAGGVGWRAMWQWTHSMASTASNGRPPVSIWYKITPRE